MQILLKYINTPSYCLYIHFVHILIFYTKTFKMKNAYS